MVLSCDEGVTECSNERDILALSGTLYQNSKLQYLEGKLSRDEAKGWLAMFEAAGSGIPDGKLCRQLEMIPLKLDKDKAEKDMCSKD